MIYKLSEEGDKFVESAVVEDVSGLLAEHVGNKPCFGTVIADRGDGGRKGVQGCMSATCGAEKLEERVCAYACVGAEVGSADSFVATGLYRAGGVELEGIFWAVYTVALGLLGESGGEEEKEENEEEGEGDGGVHVDGRSVLRGVSHLLYGVK